MKTIQIQSQKDWDALPTRFEELTVVELTDGFITVHLVPENVELRLLNSSRAELWDSSHAELRDSSRAVLWDSSRAELWDSSRAVLRDSSSAVLRNSSRAVLWDSSSAELWGSSSAELWNSSRAELLGFSVAWIYSTRVRCKKSKTATIIHPKEQKDGTVKAWLESDGVVANRGFAIVFKRVSKEWQTQEGTKNETVWPVGKSVDVPDWNPDSGECGSGKLHACSRPYFCDEFRSRDGDRYIAIKVAVKDMRAWKSPQYPHKIAFRKGLVLYECDRFGKPVKP